MLYLSIFLNVFKKHYVAGMIFISASVVAVLLSFHHEKMENYLGQKFEVPKSFFHAIVSGSENHQRLARKLRELPGVEAVNVIDEKALKGQWNSMLKDWDLEDLKNFEGLTNLDYSGLKVVFQDAISQRSEKLVMEYVQRLVGRENVTMSSIKRPEPELFVVNKKGFFEQPIAWAYVLGGVVWFFAMLAFSDKIQKESYLVENFQRNSNVQLKVALMISVLFLIVPMFVALALPQPSLMGGIYALVMVVLTFATMGLKKWSWH